MQKPTDFEDFKALSAALGQDPLQVQGPGGNTSIKENGVMWIKASGTELADAQAKDIFVPVDQATAIAEARGEAGDGSCKEAVLDPAVELRPSIETTFHAALPWPVVAHTHSVATLVHAISPEGRSEADAKLADLPFVRVPYAKPGLPLTEKILATAIPETRVFVLQNHGLICCGATVDATRSLLAAVEDRLKMPKRARGENSEKPLPPNGFVWTRFDDLACDPLSFERACRGSYYPDHVVFLGPALPKADHAESPPAILIEGVGAAVRKGSTPSQHAMLKCLADVLLRLPEHWTAEPIGAEAEASLLNWDAEKYRQALAARS